MVKFVITEEAMSPIAQALSGQSRMAGVAAGLKNQMLGLELDKMREERQQAERQRQTRENLIPNRISRLFPQLSEGARNILAGQLTGQKPEQGVPSDLFQYQTDRHAAEHAMTLPQWENARQAAHANIHHGAAQSLHPHAFAWVVVRSCLGALVVHVVKHPPHPP